MAKKLQYPNKQYLINKAIKNYPDYKTFGLVGFRDFNTTNTIDKQIYAVVTRIKSTNYSLKQPTLLVLCYLTKQGKKLGISQSVLDMIEKEIPNLKLVCEKELESLS